MLIRGLPLVLSLLAVGPAFGQEALPPIHAAAYTAVKGGDVEKAKLLGFVNDKRPFDESNIKGGVLVGFDCGLSLFFDKEIVTAVRPVYRTSAGMSYGREYGKFEMAPADKKRRGDGVVRVVRLRAKPGYAVGGLKMRSGLGIDGFSLMYHKIDGKGLEATPSFRSEWVGNTTGGSESSMTTSGQPVVGVYGTTNDEKNKVNSLGFLAAKRQTDSADVRSGVAVRPAPPKEKPKEPEQPGEKEQPQEPVPAKEPEKPKEVDVPVEAQAALHRDDNLHYTFDVPDGWRAFTKAELDRVNSLLQTRYEAGFKPKDQKGNYPYVVVRTQLARHAGLSLEKAEPMVERDVHSPAVDASGSLTDLLGGLPADKAGLDRARSRLVTRSTVETPASGRVRTLTVYHLGNQSVIALRCCSKDDSFDKYLPAFARMNDSFAFDEAFGFQPPPAADAEDAGSSRLWTNLVPLVVFAVALLPFLVILGRKKAKPEKEDDEKPRGRKRRDRDEEEEPRRPGERKLNTAGIQSSLAAQKFGTVGPPVFFVAKSSNRWTRIYVTGEALLVIDIGVGKSQQFGANGGQVGGAIGGMLGGLIDELVTHRNLQKMSEVMDKLDQLDRLELIEFARSGGRNHYLPIGELRYARIDAPSWWESLFHTMQGRLSVRHPRKAEFRFVFERLEDMKSAMELLPAALGDLLELNVVLNRRTWKYVRK